MTTFDALGAGSGAGQGKIPGFINTAGTSEYGWNERRHVRGFKFCESRVIRTADGTISDFGCPGSGTIAYQGTWAFSINDVGMVRGFCQALHSTCQSLWLHSDAAQARARNHGDQ